MRLPCTRPEPPDPSLASLLPEREELGTARAEQEAADALLRRFPDLPRQ